MRLVDSHCHLDMLDLSSHDGKLRNALDAARQHGVCHFLCVSVRLDHFSSMLDKIKDYADVSASLGLHPDEKVDNEPEENELIALARQDKVIAIGETGLDYYRCSGDLTWQQTRFRRHIRIAKKLKKPLIIHTRQARADTLRILEEENASEVSGVMHCFTEDWETAKKALDLGFYISFSGIVTFKNAKELQEVAKRVPLERMLIETDSPFLAPHPHRGHPNEPAYVRHVADFLSELLSIDVEQIAEKTTENFFNLFNLRKEHV